MFKKVVLRIFLGLAVVPLLATPQIAISGEAYPWEGFWHGKAEYCSSEDVSPPMGFFANRVDNWEAQCKVVDISRAGDQTSFDTLHLQCESEKSGKYTQDMRLRINSDGKLVLMWPGGVFFVLARCPN